MEEHISAALLQVDPVKLAEQTKEIYGWMCDNVMAFALYSYEGLWPVGPKLDPDWAPIGYSDM